MASNYDRDLGAQYTYDAGKTKERPKRKTILTPTKRLAKIAAIIEHVDNRCMAYDGPVGNTREEMTDDEMRGIYKLAKKPKRKKADG